MDGHWLILGSLSEKKSTGVAAATFASGDALFVGGLLANSAASAVANKIDYETGVVTTWPSLSVGRMIATCVRDGADRILVVGGKTSPSSSSGSTYVDCYDSSGVRTSLPALSTVRYNAVCGLTGGGDVIVTGGSVSGLVANRLLVDSYNPSGVKTVRAPMQHPAESCCTIADGSVVFACGVEKVNNEYIGHAEKINSDFSSSVIGTIGMIRSNPVVADSAGGALFLGGFTNTGSIQYSATVERIGDPSKRAINIPAFHVYKFEEHTSKQPAQPMDSIAVINAPNIGYFQMEKGTITI